MCAGCRHIISLALPGAREPHTRLPALGQGRVGRERAIMWRGGLSRERATSTIPTRFYPDLPIQDWVEFMVVMTNMIDHARHRKLVTLFLACLLIVQLPLIAAGEDEPPEIPGELPRDECDLKACENMWMKLPQHKKKGKNVIGAMENARNYKLFKQ